MGVTVPSDLTSMTVGDLHQMRCARGCGGRPVAAWLATGLELNKRIRPGRMALIRPEAWEQRVNLPSYIRGVGSAFPPRGHMII